MFPIELKLSSLYYFGIFIRDRCRGLDWINRSTVEKIRGAGFFNYCKGQLFPLKWVCPVLLAAAPVSEMKCEFPRQDFGLSNHHHLVEKDKKNNCVQNEVKTRRPEEFLLVHIKHEIKFL